MGDIIVVEEYVNHDVKLKRHSFVVIRTGKNKICGLDYDLICNVMSSFHSEEHRQKKLRFPGNLEYSAENEIIPGGAHGKPGYIKAAQLYYFDSDFLDFYVLGRISDNLLDRLTDLINNLDNVEGIKENLK